MLRLINDSLVSKLELLVSYMTFLFTEDVSDAEDDRINLQYEAHLKHRTEDETVLVSKSMMNQTLSDHHFYF